MTSPTPAIAVAIFADPARQRLWRSIASVAAQTLPPAQIVVVGRESADGLADWLRLRWPGVELCIVPDGADPGRCAAAAITAPLVAMLEAGQHWQPEHLARLAAAPGEGLTAVSELPTAWPATATLAEPPPDRETMDAALAGLPAGDGAALLDLRAAAEPAGLLDLLGLSASLGALGRTVRALSLAELSWAALEALPAGTPLLVHLGAPLDLRRASEQLCIEELARRAGDRPVRLILQGLGPSPPKLRSRLLEAVAAHPDLELWVGDAVSRRYAMSVLERRRIRLVAPPMLSLVPMLRELGRLVEPAMLGAGPATPDLSGRMASHAAWWQGFDRETAHRVGLTLARVLGLWRWLKGPLLQQAWLTALVGWAAVRAAEPRERTDELDLALFTALCGRKIVLAPDGGKVRDLVSTWRDRLALEGIEIG